MVRQFFWVAGILTGLGSTVVLHYLFIQYSAPNEKLSALVKLTGITSLSLGSAYYEPRLLGEPAAHPAYPQMQSIDRTDFVYVR